MIIFVINENKNPDLLEILIPTLADFSTHISPPPIIWTPEAITHPKTKVFLVGNFVIPPDLADFPTQSLLSRSPFAFADTLIGQIIKVLLDAAPTEAIATIPDYEILSGQHNYPPGLYLQGQLKNEVYYIKTSDTLIVIPNSLVLLTTNTRKTL